jgi:hypothetical protein
METAKNVASESSGQVWIWVKESIPSLQDSIVAIKLTVVNELIDASILNTAEAEQVIRRANQEYSKYRWQPVPARGSDRFVVQGELRPE